MRSDHEDKMRSKLKTGLTLIEIVLVTGLTALLIGFTTISLLGTRSQASISSTVDQVIADLKEQQIKAMVGDTEGRLALSEHSVSFEADRYILFHGQTYDPDESSNAVFELDDAVEFTGVTFPSSKVVFATGSGEVVGFVPGSNTLTIRNKNTSEQKTITVNKLGTITQLN